MFYVYVYRDPRPSKNLQPVYVGKGRDKRAWDHWKRGNTGNKPFNNWLTLIRRVGLEPVIEVVVHFEDEALAHAKEIELIALYGRRDLKTGPLFNLTLGGEGTVGAIRTQEWRRNMSAALNTPEQRKSNSERSTERWADPAYHEIMAAKIRAAISDPEIAAKREAAKTISHRTQEFRAKMGAISKAIWEDPAYRERMSASRAATAATEPERSRKSAATKAAWADPARKASRSAAISAGRRGQPNRVTWDESRRQEQSARMKAVLASPEAKAQRGATMRARWADPEQRAAILASRKT